MIQQAVVRGPCETDLSLEAEKKRRNQAQVRGKNHFFILLKRNDAFFPAPGGRATIGFARGTFLIFGRETSTVSLGDNGRGVVSITTEVAGKVLDDFRVGTRGPVVAQIQETAQPFGHQRLEKGVGLSLEGVHKGTYDWVELWREFLQCYQTPGQAALDPAL